MNRTYQNRFLTVGTGLAVFLTILSIAGWIESLENRDKFRHCMFMSLDGANTDSEVEQVERTCRAQTGYREE